MKQIWAEAFLLLVFTGCEFFSFDRTIRIIMPEVPSTWQELDLNWELSYRIHKNILIREQIHSKLIDLTFPKGLTAVFLLTPQFHSLELKPAGGFLLSSEEKDIVYISWENGWLAQVLDRVLKSGGNLEYLNIKKLESSLFKKRDSTSPWNFDQEFFLLELAGLKANYYSFQKAEIHVKLQIPEGIWLNVDPFSEPLRGPDLVEKTVPYGVNNYFSLEKSWSFQSNQMGTIDYILKDL